MRSSAGKVAAVAAAAAVLAVGCSRSADTGSTASGSNVSSDEKVVKIGMIGPLTGSLSGIGVGFKNSIDLAVNEANASGRLKGWKIVLDAQDDTGKPEPGAAAATKLSSDDTVAGVIGTYNTSVAQQAAPILQRAHVAQISPANTGPGLTRGAEPENSPKRVWDNYFRVCTTDLVQGPFAADYAYKTAGFKTVVSVNDKKAYGQGLAETFEKQFEKLGGNVLSRETVSEDDRDFGSLVTKITGLKPDFVFYGGEYPAAAPLSAQLGQASFTGPVIGGDGIQDIKYIEGGGRVDDIGTNVGAPPEKLSSAKKFIDAYKAAGYSEEHSAYGPGAYDATNIMIQALIKVLPDATDIVSARPKVIEAIQATKDYDGVAGKTSFDEYGDTTNKILTVWKSDGKAWKDVFTGTFAG